MALDTPETSTTTPATETGQPSSPESPQTSETLTQFKTALTELAGRVVEKVNDAIQFVRERLNINITFEQLLYLCRDESGKINLNLTLTEYTVLLLCGTVLGIGGLFALAGTPMDPLARNKKGVVLNTATPFPTATATPQSFIPSPTSAPPTPVLPTAVPPTSVPPTSQPPEKPQALEEAVDALIPAVSINAVDTALYLLGYTLISTIEVLQEGLPIDTDLEIFSSPNLINKFKIGTIQPQVTVPGFIVTLKDGTTFRAISIYDLPQNLVVWEPNPECGRFVYVPASTSN